MNFGTSIAQRPTTLLLNLSTNKTDSETLVAVKQTTNGRKKRCRASEARVKKFLDIYQTTGESLGEGSFGHVRAYRNIMTRKEFAVKVISKRESKSRHRVLKEIEIFHHCQGHENILQMVEFFEEEDKFYLVFEKMEGGTLLDCILNRGHLSEREASRVVRDVASGLDFLHKKGIAHRDLKPENILCMKAGQLTPVKICDFDLGSAIQIGNSHCTPVTTPELLSPVGSADFMAPEVVDVWRYQAESYDKRCDLWSLGILLYILLCGYRPFYAHCSRVGCDFNEGGECEDCLELLFQSTQQGVYSFPDPDWDKISVDAKDLIQHLLVKNPYQRYTAEQVLHHPWLSKDLSGSAQLATPIILSRNNSVRELSMFAETANAVNRLIQQQISMNELSTRTPTYTYNNQSTTDVISARDQLRDQSTSPHDSVTPVAESCGGKFQLHKQGGNDNVEMIMFLTRKHDNDVDGGVGGLSEEEDVDVDMTRRLSRLSEDDEEALIQRMSQLYDDDDLVDFTREALSALPSTTSSQVARRQAFKSHNLSECSLDSGNVSTGSSPPDY